MCCCDGAAACCEGIEGVGIEDAGRSNEDEPEAVGPGTAVTTSIESIVDELDDAAPSVVVLKMPIFSPTLSTIGLQIRLRALMNQLLTWVRVRLVCCDSLNFSSSAGYGC